MEPGVRRFDIEGLIEITPARFDDRRGSFAEAYHRERYAEFGIHDIFIQDNVSVSARGVLRGLHFQKTNPQAKLVSVLAGSAYDVVVDLRPGSASYGRWTSVTLSAAIGNQLYVPAGFAHGFYALEDGTLCHYKCSAYYDKYDEAGIRWDDPELAITWPKSPAILSPKDAALPFLKELV